MVPIRAAHSSGVDRSSPWAPSSTASSPATTSPSGPTSTITWSIVTTPTMGQRRPRRSTDWPARLRDLEDAVGVAEGQGGHEGVAVDVVAQPVRHPLPCRDRLHEGHLGGQADGGLEGDAPGQRR